MVAGELAAAEESGRGGGLFKNLEDHGAVRNIMNKVQSASSSL
jgi:hypothetical protein